MVMRMVKMLVVCAVFGGAQQVSGAAQLTTLQKKALIDFVVQQVLEKKVRIQVPLKKRSKEAVIDTSLRTGVDQKVIAKLLAVSKQMNVAESQRQFVDTNRFIRTRTIMPKDQPQTSAVDPIPQLLEESAKQAIQQALEDSAQGQSTAQVGVALEEAAHKQVIEIVATLLSAGLTALGLPVSATLIEPLAQVAVTGIYTAGSYVVEAVEQSPCCLPCFKEQEDTQAILVAKDELAKLQQGLSRHVNGQREFNPIAPLQASALVKLMEATK